MLWLEVDNLTEVSEELVRKGVTVLHTCEGEYMMIAIPMAFPLRYGNHMMNDFSIRSSTCRPFALHLWLSV